LGVSYGSATEWAVEVLSEPWLLRQGLQDLDWEEAAIDAVVAEYNRLRGEGLSGTTLASRLKELLGNRELRIEEEWKERLKVPLYRFGAPSAKGAEVTYSEGISVTRSGGWSVKVFGVGTGHTTEMAVANHYTFSASDGACKQIFVPVPMIVQRIGVYEGGKRVGRGIRAEVEPPRSKAEISLRSRGCDTLTVSACRELPEDAAEDFLECDLRADSSRSIHVLEKRWSSDLASDLSLHLKKIIEVGPFVRVRRLRELSLRFSLPAGHDYRGHLCRGRLWWERPVDA
jgi:hypothetical protein